MLWAVMLIDQCGGKLEHYLWSILVFFVSSVPRPLLSTVYQYDMRPSSQEHGGLMAGLSGFASHRCNLHHGAGCQ